MNRDKDIEDAIAAGKKNAATMDLVKNWCAHVRVEKFGGTGLIEAQTGYPIGHHSLQCDHAPMGGAACWDLRDSALDFYDSNCINCSHRKPVGLPNMSQLVAERDQAQARRDAEAKEAERREAVQAEARNEERQKLRATLSPVAATILDDIAAFDRDHSRENLNRLTESARLAPEHYSDNLLAYVFDLAETEGWFVEAGIAILHSLNADKNRLARLAVNAVKYPLAYDKAVEILTAHSSQLQSSDVTSLLIRAVEKASPNDEHFIGLSRPKPDTAFLRLLWEQFPDEVVVELESLLSSRKRYLVELAGRGFLVLQSFDPMAANGSARNLVSTYARAYLLIDDLDRHHERLNSLNEAISGIFRNIPDDVDEIVQEIITGSDRDSRARAFNIYSNVLRTSRFTDSKDLVPEDSLAHSIAFRRMLWAATTEEDDNILQEVAGVFRSKPYELELIARAEIDGLLGATLLLDDRLSAIDSVPRDENENWLQVMERRNKRSMINRLMSSYIEWVAVAAQDDQTLIDQIIDMMDAIPEGRDQLKGITLGVTQHLATSVAGLKRILPHLYYGLVGPSALVRSYAATALSEVRHNGHSNIPSLVYEAFCVLLWDQYLIVHKAAVRALRRFSLPEKHRLSAAQAVLNLLYYYRGREGEDDFVVQCIERLASWSEVFGKGGEALSKILVDAALTVEPLYLRNELHFLSHALEGKDALADLLLYMLPHLGDDFNRDDETWRLLQLLSDRSVLARQEKFVSLGKSVLLEKPWLTYEITERLSLAGASDASLKLAELSANEVPDTVRNRSIRMISKFVSIAHAYEAGIAAGADAKLNDLRSQWDGNMAEQEQQKADSHERRSRTDLSFPD